MLTLRNKLLLITWLLLDVLVSLFGLWPYFEDAGDPPYAYPILGAVFLSSIVFFIKFKGRLSFFLKWLCVYSGFYLIPMRFILYGDCYPEVGFFECQEKNIIIAIFFACYVATSYALGRLAAKLITWLRNKWKSNTETNQWDQNQWGRLIKNKPAINDEITNHDARDD